MGLKRNTLHPEFLKKLQDTVLKIWSFKRFHLTHVPRTYYKTGQCSYYKSGQLLVLQIGANFITNRGNSFYYKSGQFYYKSGQVLQIGADLLQIGAGITNRGNYYKSVQNNSIKKTSSGI